MPYETATIAGSIFDWVTVRQSVRVRLTRLEGAAIDGNNAHLSGLDVQYAPDRDAVAPVVATGTYRVRIDALSTSKDFAHRDFIAPITADTSWGEVLSYDGTGYEYTPDELARLVAVEQAIENGLPSPGAAYTDHGNQSGALTIAADDGTHAMVLTGDLSITLTGSNGDGVIIDASGSYALTVAGIDVTDLTVPAAFLKSKGSWKWLNTLAESAGPVDPDLTPATPAFPLTFTDDGTTRTYVVPTTTGVNYYLGGSLLTAGTKTATPLQAVTVTPLAQATYTLTSSTPWTHTFAADPSDTTAPTAPTLSVDNSSQTQLVATFGGGTDAVGVTRYRTRIDAGSWTIATSAGSRTFAGLTASTSHTIDAQAGDAAGNWSTSTSLTRSTAAVPVADPATVILADSPIYYLPMKDAPGTTAVQNLGSGSVAWTNTGAVFDGEKANISAPGVTHIAADNSPEGRQIIGDRTAITLEMTVVMPTQNDGGNIFRSPDSFILAYGSGGSVFAANAANPVSGSAQVDTVGSPSGNPAAFTGVHHVAYTYDGTTQKLYFDGTLVGSSARTGPIVNNNYDQCFIGGRNPYFTVSLGNVSVAHFAITASALSAGRIAAHSSACIADLS